MGIFDIEIVCCICANTPDLDVQLLQAQILPSSFKNIEIVFTFSLLRRLPHAKSRPAHIEQAPPLVTGQIGQQNNNESGQRGMLSLGLIKQKTKKLCGIDRKMKKRGS
jgi:hypothetical protein